MKQYARWARLWDVRIISEDLLGNQYAANQRNNHSCGPTATASSFCVSHYLNERKQIYLIIGCHIFAYNITCKHHFHNRCGTKTPIRSLILLCNGPANGYSKKKNQCSKEAEKQWRRHAKLLADTDISLSSNLFEREDNISTEQNTQIHMRNDPNGCWICKAIHFLWIEKSKCFR